MDPQYLVLGHSLENIVPFEERPKIPPGYTLLLFTECDVATGTEDIHRAIQLASQVPLDLSKFRIYREGDSFPPINLVLLSDFFIGETSKGKTLSAIARSGVYSVPIDQQEFEATSDFIERYWSFDEESKISTWRYIDTLLRIPKSSKSYKTYKKSVVVDENAFEKDLIEFQFTGAVYPIKNDITKYLDETTSIDELKSKLKITLQDLFRKLGPGLYIVPSCRSLNISKPRDHDELFQYIEEEIDPELANKLTFRHDFNRQKYRKQKLNFLNSLKNHPKLQKEPWKEIYDRVRNDLRRVMKTVENTRSKSALKQRGIKTRKRNTRR